VVVRLLPPPSDLHATRPVIIIHHDPIAGLMDESMDMPFIAASSELFRDLRAGDRIAFGLQATPDALLVVSIKRLFPPRARSTSD
jgi:Cu/Ag efflux protein CusF